MRWSGSVSRLLFTALALCIQVAAWAKDTSVIDLPAQFSFASKQQAASLLTSVDEWTALVGTAQLASLHANPRHLAAKDVAPLFGQIARDCSMEEKQRWGKAFSDAWQRIGKLKLRWPERINLICSNGLDAPAAPYTRQNFIVLPQPLNTQGHTDMELAAHELFHVFSRFNPQLHNRIYALFKFRPAAEFEWPESWKSMRITNPDAPHNRHVITLTIANTSFDLMPLLLAHSLPDGKNQNFFDVMGIRLVPVEPSPDGQSSRVKLIDGRMRSMDAMRSQEYFEATGQNTLYLLHPEEIAADNFAFLVSERKVSNPQLIDSLRQILQQSSN